MGGPGWRCRLRLSLTLAGLAIGGASLPPPSFPRTRIVFRVPPPARRCALGGVPLGAARPERDSLLTAPGLRACAGVTCAGQYDGWRGGKPPYFSPSTPLDSSAPGGRPFFYTPGENYTFPPPGYSIEIWDDDESGTLNGYIPLKKESQCPTEGTPGSTGWDCTNGNVQCDNRKGCWDSFGIEYFANQKYVEDPVHVEVGAYIGSHEWDPGTSRWWFPYKNSKDGTWSGAYYDQDPLEDIKQKYRCSEYNPTLPGLDWHKPTGGNSYPGGLDQKLHFPNSHEQAKECWDQYKVGSRPLASSKLNVSYTHVTENGIVYTNRTRLSIQWTEDESWLDADIPNPQRIICLTWKGMIGTNRHMPSASMTEAERTRIRGIEKSRCWSVIFNVRPKLSVCASVDSVANMRPDPQKCGKSSLFKTNFDNLNTDGDLSIVPVAVGQELKSYVYFEDGNSDFTTNCSMCDDVTISVLSNPGIPNSARLGATKGRHDVNNASDAPSRLVPVFLNGEVSAASYYQFSRRFEFKPDEKSATKVFEKNERNGLKYKMCFVARSTTTTFYPPGTLTQSSKEYCAFIQVVRPELDLHGLSQLQSGVGDEVLPMVAPNLDNVPSLGLKWLKMGHTEPVRGRHLENAELQEALRDKTEFSQKEWNSFGVEDLHIDDFVESNGIFFRPDRFHASFDHNSLPFKARVNCPYKWKVEVVDKKDEIIPAEAIGEDASFRFLSESQSGYQKGVYKPRAKVDPENPLPKGAVLSPYDEDKKHQILSWSPERGSEGQSFTFCLWISEAVIDEGRYLRCTNITVQKCEVCGRPSDTLHSISMEYGTDWLQLWGANHDIENPNSLNDYVPLKLGPMYTLNKRQDLETLASRFSMTSSDLRRVNPDLHGQNDLAADTTVCLIPRICGSA